MDGHFQKVCGIRHSCLPRPHSWGRSWMGATSRPATRVETSLDTAGTSAGATSAGQRRLISLKLTLAAPPWCWMAM